MLRLLNFGERKADAGILRMMTSLMLRLAPMQNYHESSLVNIGTGVDITIKELAETIQEIVGYEVR
jgi:nucleoside-diphosphate-sugar epimerase